MLGCFGERSLEIFLLFYLGNEMAQFSAIFANLTFEITRTVRIGFDFAECFLLAEFVCCMLLRARVCVCMCAVCFCVCLFFPAHCNGSVCCVHNCVRIAGCFASSGKR